MKVRTSLLKEETRELTEKLTFTEKALDELIVRLPNIPAEQVKSGKSAADNEVVLQEGNIPSLGSDALPIGNWPKNTISSALSLEQKLREQVSHFI